MLKRVVVCVAASVALAAGAAPRSSDNPLPARHFNCTECGTTPKDLPFTPMVSYAAARVGYTTVTAGVQTATRSAQLDSAAQKLIAGGVAATIQVAPIGRNDFEIDVVFRSSTYPVGCLSAYRDLQYELRDTDNRIVPVNQRTLKSPPYEGPGTINHATKGDRHDGCAAKAPQGVWPEFARFSALYPNLPSGKYTLHITFAPHGTTQHADFAPIPISVGAFVQR